MRFFIVEDLSCDLKPGKNEILTVVLPGVGRGDRGVSALSPNFYGQGGNQKVRELLGNFNRAFRAFHVNFFGSTKTYDGEDSTFLIKFESTAGVKKERLWNIEMNCEFLDELSDFFYESDPSQDPELGFKLVMKCHEYNNGKMTTAVLLEAKDFFQNQEDYNIFEKDNIPQLIHPQGKNDDKTSFSFSLEIVADSLLPLCLNNFSKLPEPSEGNRKIYEERSFPDFEIVTENDKGKCISNPCHKIFLASQSDVFKRMFESDFKEAQKNRVELNDISPEGVTALLKFLYYNDLKDPVTHPNVAYELLRAADMYNISNLWTAMITIFLAKPLEWFDCDVALNLFSFVRDCCSDYYYELVALKGKIMEVLYANCKILSQSPLFTEVFQTATARELFTLAITPKY